MVEAWSKLLILIAVSVSVARGDRFYILPASSSPCPGEFTGELCFTLQEYISGVQVPSPPSSQVILQLLPGRHYIQSSLHISDRVSFEMVGEGSTSVTCSGSMLSLRRIRTVSVRGIVFNRCTASISSINGTLTIEDTTFQDRGSIRLRHPIKLSEIADGRLASSAFVNGHSLEVTSSTLHFNMTTFSGNRLAGSNRIRPCSGAAMRCTSSTITAEQSTFTGNSVACDGTHARTVGMGGAIWAQFTNLKIIGSTFSNNLAVQNGGAVYAFGSSVSVQGSRFSSNSAPGGTFTQGTGGALYLDSIRNSQVNINQSDFTNNSKVAVYISGGSSRDNDYDVIISNCTFTRSSGGRAVHVRYATSITVIGSSFASNDGGGLYATGNDITFLLEESTFSDNVARQCVAIEVEGNNQHINFSSGNTFTYNRIGDGFSARSKVVCVKNAFMSVANSTFSHNWISGTFGVLYATSSNVSIQGSDFYNNTATNGAAIYVTACSLSINQSRFTSNTASSGGALFVSRGNVTLHQCSFTSNSAVQENGGALKHFSNDAYTSVMTITHSMFLNNSANGLTGKGGVVHTSGVGNHVTLVDSTFDNNRAGGCAVLEVEGSNHQVELNASIFTNNQALGTPTNAVGVRIGSGGVACISIASTSITNSSFTDNAASRHGGVLYYENGAFFLNSSTFRNNIAGQDGGVIYTRLSPITLTVNQTLFTGNQAGRDGGALFVGRTGSSVDIEKSSIQFNTASRRGGVAVVLGSALVINETVIFGNTAMLGGVVSACSSDVIIPDEIAPMDDSTNSLCTLYDGDVCDACTYPPTTAPTETTYPSTTYEVTSTPQTTPTDPTDVSTTNRPLIETNSAMMTEEEDTSTEVTVTDTTSTTNNIVDNVSSTGPGVTEVTSSNFTTASGAVALNPSRVYVCFCVLSLLCFTKLFV